MSTTIETLLLISALIALGFLLAVAFYESLSTRDVLVGRVMRITHRLSSRRWVTGIAYLVTVGIGIPLLVVVWTIVLEMFLLVVGSVERIDSLALVAASIVGAARILAYARQKTAHELAKAIPLSFAFVLLTGGAINLDEKLTRVVAEPDRSSLTPEILGFLVILEIGLRIMSDGSHLAMAELRRRRGVTSDVGVWRTIWAAFRRPLADAVPDPSPTGPSAPPDDTPFSALSDDRPPDGGAGAVRT
jgi:hypothetical protein